MKKIAKKLVLSAVSMGLAVATLSTTTFAWYVSNTTAKVQGANGATAGTEVGGNLLVAQNISDTGGDKPGNFTSSISLTGSDVQLTPVSKVLASDVGEEGAWADKGLAEGDWVDASGKKWSEIDGNEGKNPYIEYKFWILSTDATTINVTATLENTTSEPLTQTVYAAGDYLPTSVDQEIGKAFTADAVYALAAEITSQKANETNTGLGTDPATTLGSGSLKSLVSPTYSTKAGMVTGGDANKYYRAVLGKDSFGTTATTGASTRNADAESAWTSLTVTAGTAQQIVIRIWLEGADSDCWDSCRKQTFKLDLNFAVAAKD